MSCRLIYSGDYRKAFLACRKHRVDLNVLVDRDLDAFRQRLSSFVAQIEDVDHINLFLTSLGYVNVNVPERPFEPDVWFRYGSHSPEVISELCDGIRTVLEKRDLRRYINCILTAFVVKRPPDHEAGLRVLLKLKGVHSCTPQIQA